MADLREKIRVSRIIPFPKSGEILPHIPIFADLSVFKSVAGGATAVAKTIIHAKNAKKKLKEALIWQRKQLVKKVSACI